MRVCLTEPYCNDSNHLCFFVSIDLMTDTQTSADSVVLEDELQSLSSPNATIIDDLSDSEDSSSADVERANRAASSTFGRRYTGTGNGTTTSSRPRWRQRAGVVGKPERGGGRGRGRNRGRKFRGRWRNRFRTQQGSGRRLEW